MSPDRRGIRPGWAFLALLVLLSPAPARAEWQVRPFLGVRFGGDSTLFALNLEDAVGKPNLTVGVSGGLVGEVFGVEVDVARVPGAFKDDKKLILKSSITTVTGNVTVALPRRLSEYTLRPYFVGGAGLLRPQVTDTSSVFPLTRNMTAIDLGGGATGFLTRQLGVNWDFRHFRSINNRPQGVDSVGDESLSFWRATMALAFRY